MKETMNAVVYYGENDIRFEERPVPTILEPTDAIIKMVKTTICGTDLGIKHGKNPEIQENGKDADGTFNGRILGHEGIGIVEEVGAAVKDFKKGDPVIVSCISRCGTCENCQKQLHAHCTNGGSWILGYMIDGTQAEYVRTPFADNSLYHLPEEMDADIAVMMSDALPTGHEIGIQYGEVKPGDVVAIVGAGPVGMGCLLTAKLYSPSEIIMIDMDDNRLEQAKEMGATYVFNPSKVDVKAEIDKITDNQGCDCAVEAVGIPVTWDLCQFIVKPGGHISNVGVHGAPVTFNLEDLWIKNLTIRTGLVNANTTKMLMKAIDSNDPAVKKLITHHFNFKDMEKAYEVFENAAQEKAMKVVIDF